MKITDEMLVAFADGELDAKDREAVMRAVAADPELGQKLAAHQRLRETLTGHFAPIMEQAAPERLKALLVPGGESQNDNVVSLAAVRAIRKEKANGLAPRRWLPAWGNVAAIAATLVLGIAVGQSMNEGSPVGVSGGGLMARGELAETLDTQLASVQDGGIETRIGLTFRGKDGAICRTFEGEALSGLACRAAGRWRFEQILPGRGAASDYRQASAGDPRLAASVQRMIAGAPFDANAERMARSKGWE